MAYLQTAVISGRQYQQEFPGVLQAGIASFRGLTVHSPAAACGGSTLPISESAGLAEGADRLMDMSMIAAVLSV